MKNLEIKLPINNFEVTDNCLIIKDAAGVSHFLRKKDNKHISVKPFQFTPEYRQEFINSIAKDIEEKIESLQEKIFDYAIDQDRVKLPYDVIEEIVCRTLSYKKEGKPTSKAFKEAVETMKAEGWKFDDDENKTDAT